MKEIIFHGPLKTFSKKSFFTVAKTWKEICQAMQCNISGYKNIRKKLAREIDFLYFIIDGEIVKESYLFDSKIKNAKKIEIIPVVPFGGPAKALFVFVMKLVVVFAISYAISYFMAKLMTPKDPKQVTTSSYIVDGKVNRALRNTPVPIGYGRLRIAPPVISVMNFNVDAGMPSLADVTTTKPELEQGGGRALNYMGDYKRTFPND